MRTIGKLRHRVTIQQLTPGSPQQDAGGVPDETWATHLSGIAAEVKPLKGRELFNAQQVNSEVSGTVRIRYRSGITDKMRVVYGSRIYDILYIVNSEERDRELVLYVREGPNNG